MQVHLQSPEWNRADNKGDLATLENLKAKNRNKKQAGISSLTILIHINMCSNLIYLNQ